MKLDSKEIGFLESLAKTKTRIVLSASKLDISFQTRILGVKKDSLRILNAVPLDLICSFMKSDEFTLITNQYRFNSKEISSDGVSMIFRINSLDEVAKTREAERLPFSKEDAVECELLNPYDKKTRIRFPVLDMSAGGVSLWVGRPSMLFHPDTIFEEVKIYIDRDVYNHAHGRVVYSRKTMDMMGSLGMQVGIAWQ
jgi:hypothetical protein